MFVGIVTVASGWSLTTALLTRERSVEAGAGVGRLGSMGARGGSSLAVNILFRGVLEERGYGRERG